MATRRRYGDVVAHSLGLGAAPNIATSALRGSQIAVSHITIGPDRIGMTPGIPPEDTFVLAIYLDRLDSHELWSHGRPKLIRGYAPRAMRIVNLMDEYAANILAPHEALSFYIPRAVLDVLGEEEGIPRIATIRCEPGIIDPVVRGLGDALMPVFGMAEPPTRLFLDHVTLALCGHLVQRYGGGAARTVPRGGLTAHQARRATEIMADRYADAPTLAELAHACGLSRSHFIRAFKATTGVTPHRWLQRYRVDKAKALLAGTGAPIAEIAISCGFADQSHLTRIFGRTTGDSPAAWRRHNRT